MFKYHELDDCRKKDLQLVEIKSIWLTLPPGSTGLNFVVGSDNSL